MRRHLLWASVIGVLAAYLSGCAVMATVPPGEVERWRAVGSVAKLPSSLADEGRSVKGLLALPLPAWTL